MQGVKISPLVPTVGNLAFALLWGFSALGGWGRTAFCETGSGVLDPTCSGRFSVAVVASVLPAALALLLLVGSWLIPVIRGDLVLHTVILGIAAVSWLLAEGVLVLGGYYVQP